MNCKQASKMMSMRLDGRLDNAEGTLLENHMTECSACQTEWQRFQALDSLFSTAPIASPPWGGIPYLNGSK